MTLKRKARRPTSKAPTSAVSAVTAGSSLPQQSIGALGHLNWLRQHLEPIQVLLTSYLDIITGSMRVGGGGAFFLSGEATEAIEERMVDRFTRVHFAGRECIYVAGTACDKKACLQIKRLAEGRRRCDSCEHRAANAAVRTRCTQVYPCHAGFTDIMAPIIIHGKCAGFLCVGQFLRRGRPPQTLDEVWANVRSIPGLSHAALAECFDEVPVLEEAQVRELVNLLQGEADVFARVWEGIEALVREEKELAHVHWYRVRELTEMLLEREASAREEIEARARAIGVAELPTAALVAQIDPAAWENLRMSPEERDRALSDLVATMLECTREFPNAIVAPMRRGEVVALLKPKALRNPELRRLQLDELSQNIGERAKVRVGAHVLVASGSDMSDPIRIAASYSEARHILWLSDQSAPSNSGRGPGRARATSEPLLQLPHDGDKTDEMAVISWCQQALRVVGYACEQSLESGRRMFAQTFNTLFSLLRQQGYLKDSADNLRKQFASDYSALQSYDDMTLWFKTHLLPHIEGVLGQRAGVPRRCVVKARAMLSDRMHDPATRKEVAGEAGMSDSHFGKVFRKTTGVPFRDYLALSRIARAQMLLLDPDRTIQEVAFDVGYSSLAAFSRAFSRTCGVSPSIYRRKPNAYPRIRV